MKGHLRSRDRRKIASRKSSCRRWQLVVEDGRDERGKRRQRYRSFDGTKADAERALRKFIDEIETGFSTGVKSVTVFGYFERWLVHVASRVRPRTIASYRQLADLHINPYLGKAKLTELRPMHVQDLYKTLLESGRRTGKGGKLSANSVVHVHRVLFMALRQAVRWRLVSMNVAEAVEPPRIRRIEMRTLEAAEVQALLEKARGSRLYEPILLAVTTGLRRGEILGLQWTDIDLERGRLSVSRSLQGDGSLAETKTARSRREVALPNTVLEALRRHKTRQNSLKLALGPAYVDRGFVFAMNFGESWKPDGISTLYRTIVNRAKLGRLRFHDLRHTAASLMLDQGLPITTVAAVLGHANTSTTLSLYAHAIKGSEQAAAVMMEGILQGAPLRQLKPDGIGGMRGPNEGEIPTLEAPFEEKAL